MKKFKLSLIITIILLSLCGYLAYYRSESAKWNRYFKEKSHQPPRPLFLKAFRMLDKTGHALSLGSGVGNDEALLLKDGWNLDCVEPHPVAIAIMQEKSEFRSAMEKVDFLEKSFESLTESDLQNEKYDFIYAGFSIPFISPDQFDSFWELVHHSLKNEGIFAGHFFGLEHSSLNAKFVTYLSSSTLQELFSDYEVLYWDEQKDEGEHIFRIIAKKER
jgi:SAM-dependent methyltransferase